MTAAIEIPAPRKRYAISADKAEMLLAIQRVLAEQREFWPLSLRAVHYRLLNCPPLRNSARPSSRYLNDRMSYCDLSRVVKKARLTGQISWDALTDETRPTTIWGVFDSPAEFIEQQRENLLRGYARNVLCSQPDHVEIVAEKLTVQSIVLSVAREFSLPVTVGRGYASLEPRRQIVERYQASAKRRLILLVLADHDPDGVQIGESLARSLRDDFAVQKTAALKVALTPQQVRDLNLPHNADAKKTSSHYRRFVKNYGPAVYELEAIAPDMLQRMLRSAIESVLDMGRFALQVAAEKRDRMELEERRRRALESLRADGR